MKYCKLKYYCGIIVRFLIPICVSILIICVPEPNEPTNTDKQQSASYIEFYKQIKKPDLPKILTIIGISLLMYFLTDLKSLLKNISSFSVRGVSFKINKLEKQSIKSTVNENIIYGVQFANKNQWNEAADMFLGLRNMESPMEKVQGLVESAYLIVQMYDQGGDFKRPCSEHNNGAVDYRMYLEKACEFCNLALWIAKTTDDLSETISYVYFKRAIVNSRLAECITDDGPQNKKFKNRASSDLLEAVKKNDYYLLQAVFDSKLEELIKDNDSNLGLKILNNKKYNISNMEDVPNDQTQELLNNFLEMEKHG